MQHRTLTTVPPPHDFAKTLRFPREDVITTKFSREPVDADDTVPIALYSQPYERLDIQPESRPYELIEIGRDADVVRIAAAPTTSFPLVLAISMLSGAFALGFGFAFLLL